MRVVEDKHLVEAKQVIKRALKEIGCSTVGRSRIGGGVCPSILNLDALAIVKIGETLKNPAYGNFLVAMSYFSKVLPHEFKPDYADVSHIIAMWLKILSVMKTQYPTQTNDTSSVSLHIMNSDRTIECTYTLQSGREHPLTIDIDNGVDRIMLEKEKFQEAEYADEKGRFWGYMNGDDIDLKEFSSSKITSIYVGITIGDILTYIYKTHHETKPETKIVRGSVLAPVVTKEERNAQYNAQNHTAKFKFLEKSAQEFMDKVHNIVLTKVKPQPLNTVVIDLTKSPPKSIPAGTIQTMDDGFIFKTNKITTLLDQNADIVKLLQELPRGKRRMNAFQSRSSRPRHQGGSTSKQPTETDERIMYRKRLRIVYKGSHNGKYIKINKEFVLISKLKKT